MSSASSKVTTVILLELSLEEAKDLNGLLSFAQNEDNLNNVGYLLDTVIDGVTKEPNSIVTFNYDDSSGYFVKEIE